MSETSKLETSSKLAITNVRVEITASFLALYSIWQNDPFYYNYSI